MSISANELRHARDLSCGDRHARDAAAQHKGVLGALRRLGRALAVARRRRLAVADLSRLDDRQLADIGIRREQIPRIVREIIDGSTGRGL